MFEANAIAMQIENLSTPRPMTHDLLRNVIHDLDATVTKIVVSDLQDNTFYALIYLAVKGATVAIDARPSDAIALALRTARRSSWRTPSSIRRRPSTFASEKADTDRLQEVARKPRPGRPRQVQDVGVRGFRC